MSTIATTLMTQPQWGWNYFNTLRQGDDSVYHFVGFKDTLFLYNSRSKFLYVNEKPELWKD
jgi:hypothetical protein